MNIDVSDLPGNSNMEKSKEIRKAREKNEDDVTPKTKGIAQGQVRKKPATTRISEVFALADIKDVASGVFTGVIVPNLKLLIVNVIDSAARSFFLGESVSSSVKAGAVSHIPYNSIYGNGSTATTKASKNTTSPGLNYDIVEYSTPDEGQAVLDALDEILASSGVVSIADLYEASRLSCPFTYTYYGWTNLMSAKVVFNSSTGKYYIKLPVARPIKGQ